MMFGSSKKQGFTGRSLLAGSLLFSTTFSVFADLPDEAQGKRPGNSAGLPHQEVSIEQEWSFQVFLDDKEIGTHEFRVTRQGDHEQVEITAEFDVNILFFNAYSYSHQNTERWENDCLASIDSVTDDNGTPLHVQGMARDGRFIFEANPQGPSTGPACTRSFAYWNRDFLDSEKLLNSQTGEFVDVDISRQAEEVLSIHGQPVAATRYAVEMEDGTITLWYGRETGQWLALEAPARGDRTLRYEPVRLPKDPGPDDDRLALE